MDEDGFYFGETMEGRQGLVPSNFLQDFEDDPTQTLGHDHNQQQQHELQHIQRGSYAPLPNQSSKMTNQNLSFANESFKKPESMDQYGSFNPQTVCFDN